LAVAFGFAIVVCVIGAVASLLTKDAKPGDRESVGEELAAVAGESGGGPSELVSPASER
jgi:hypothetical protein